VDYIKLWPVEQPWQETPDPLPDWLLGGYAESLAGPLSDLLI